MRCWAENNTCNHFVLILNAICVITKYKLLDDDKMLCQHLHNTKLKIIFLFVFINIKNNRINFKLLNLYLARCFSLSGLRLGVTLILILDLLWTLSVWMPLDVILYSYYLCLNFQNYASYVIRLMIMHYQEGTILLLRFTILILGLIFRQIQTLILTKSRIIYYMTPGQHTCTHWYLFMYDMSEIIPIIFLPFIINWKFLLK